MRVRSIPELLATIERAQTLRATLAPQTEAWESATRHIAELLEEMRCRTCVAVGSAFSATLMGLSQRDLDVEIATGDRLLIELRKRGLAVLPRRFVPPSGV
jgi:hypothetical protein